MSSKASINQLKRIKQFILIIWILGLHLIYYLYLFKSIVIGHEKYGKITLWF